MIPAGTMTRERWARIKPLFQLASEDPFRFDTRWLEAECAGDAGLYEAVSALLHNHRSLDSSNVRSNPLPGADRFRVEGVAGRGGFGDVYIAYDTVRRERVAVKRLRATGAEARAAFKREFRLTRIRHANLVRVHELLTEGDEWYLVMEAVDGRDLETALRAMSREEMLAALPVYFSQIFSGLRVLHSQKILHGDVKPSNIRVTSAGRVVLLDFGLAASVEPLDSPKVRELIGTVDYISPEQVAGLGVSIASDWYAAGVALYRALTGMSPYAGPPSSVLRAKTEFDPLHPCEAAPDAPHEWGEICMALLCRDPAARLERVHACSTATQGGPPGGESRRFIGRAAELDWLRDSWNRAGQAARSEVVTISGDSGIGKTTLALRFFDSIGGLGCTLLRARCYQAESVPYKAFDGMIDALVERIAAIGSPAVDSLADASRHALLRLFPAFSRVSSVLASPTARLDGDQVGLRRLAMQALRQVLSEAGRTSRLAILLDDIQWGSAEDAELAEAVFLGEDSPPCLIVAIWPSADSAAPLPSLFSAHPRTASLELCPLGREDAHALAVSLLPDGAASLVPELVAESANSPYLIHEFATLVTRADRGVVRFDARTISQSRLQELDAVATMTLRIVAAAGGPLPEEVVRVAVGAKDSFARSRDILLDSRWVRSSLQDSSVQLDIYHSLQRVTLTDSVAGPELNDLHERIANALESCGAADPERILGHLRFTPHRARTAEYAERAGDQAASQLAFGRAAKLFEEAVELRSAGPSAQLWQKLGTALAHAGHGQNAAEAFTKAAEADPASSLECRILATEQMLRCGSVDEGLAALKELSIRFGVSWPKSTVGLLSSLVYSRTKLRLRGLNERPVSRSGDLSPKLDICWAGTVGASMSDPLRSAEYSCRHLELALKTGDPRRLSLAFASEAVHALPEFYRLDSAPALMSRARQYASGLGDPSIDGFVDFMDGIIACNDGRWDDCVSLCQRALEAYRQGASGVSWDRVTASSFILSSRMLLGDWSTAEKERPDLMADARERGDRYAAVNLSLLTSSYWHDLARGEPEVARRQARRLLAIWDRKHFDLQHFYAFVAEVNASSYEARTTDALRLVIATYPKLRQTGQLRFPLMRILANYLAGTCYVAHALTGPVGSRARSAALRHASRYSSRLKTESLAYARGVGLAVEASIASASGDPHRARNLLSGAQESLEQAKLIPWAAACRAHLTRDYPGDAWFARETVADPERLANLLVPGEWARV